MSAMPQKSMQIELQAKFFDFAVLELVLNHRESFQPLWTIDSWAKFMIWMALNCGLSGERESLEIFAESLGSPLTSRMRRCFFERTVDEIEVKIMADPAENYVLIMPINADSPLSFDKANHALKQVKLLDRIVNDRSSWQVLDSAIGIPWES